MPSQPGPQSSCPQCSLSHTPLTSWPTLSWFPCELHSVGALLQCEHSRCLGKGNLRSSLHTLSFEKLHHRHDFRFIQSPLVSSQCLCLPANQHWLDFPRASQTQNVQNWTHCLPPQNLFFLLFPLFLWMIPPSSQLPKPETRASS